MQSRKTAAATMVAAFALALGGASIASAGSTTYAVQVAPNGGVGGCQSSTGTMSNVTSNNGSSAITIQCPTPNGFAWGRNLDTPDEVVDAALIDDGSDVVAGFKQTGANNSNGRKLGLMMRVADMRPNQTDVEFEGDAVSGLFTADFPLLPNGKASKRANLKLRLPKSADLLEGSASCAKNGEATGITWSAGDSIRGKSYRAYTPKIVVDCSGISASANAVVASSLTNSMSPDSTNAKQMTNTASCSTGKAIAGGYDISGSTTSQWPQIVFNGPESATTWKVTVSVPSQTSSSAKASLRVWVTCSGN